MIELTMTQSELQDIADNAYNNSFGKGVMHNFRLKTHLNYIDRSTMVIVRYDNGDIAYIRLLLNGLNVWLYGK